MPEPTWEQRERPILEAVHAVEERDGWESATSDKLVAETGLAPDIIGRTVEALIDAEYLGGVDATSLGDDHPVYVAVRLRERGRRDVGVWPPSVADAFLGKLDYMIANASDTDERTKLKKLRDAAGEISKGVISGAIVAAGSAAL